MASAVIAILAGLILLVWSADRFIESAASIARHFEMPPLLIGMVIVGFGTSSPELAVSVMAALQGNPAIALGNAYGSNIVNIALILGLTAIISPIALHSMVLRKELPILTAVTAATALLLWDGKISRADSLMLLAIFSIVMGWAIRQGMRNKGDALENEIETELAVRAVPMNIAIMRLVAGLALLMASSRILVWGAVKIAHSAGVSDLVIGLTIVAAGTGMPELASSIIAARKGESDIAIGNVLGSNLFNTLAVVGIAGMISPMHAGAEVLHRDMPVMAILTLSLFIIGYGFRGPGRINRIEGAALVIFYAGYVAYLLGAMPGF